MNSSDNETVNGSRVAARIINNLPEDHKRRILSSIQVKNPEIFRKIEENLVTIDDIAYMNARGVQSLIKEISNSDLIILLKNSSQNVRENIFTNLSQRMVKVISEDLVSAPENQKAEIDACLKRIIIQIDALRTAGIAHFEDEEETWV